MTNIWLISDLHLGHANICKFLRQDGTKVRPWDDPNEMDEAIIANWNSVVKPEDRVYNLGDCVINRRHLHLLSRLNGKKRLIRGNHDIFRTADYLDHFDEIYGVRVLDDMILSHYPLHPESVNRPTNVHGHLHHNDIDDGLYYNVCVENIGYTPVAIEDLRKLIAVKKALFPTTVRKIN
jgi:calcineurin-like phosphoesterase family protein